MKAKDIKQTISRGQVLHTPYVRVHLNASPASTSASRLACVVSKKISQSAVHRHHYQRWLREAVRPLVTPLAPNILLVLIAKPAILKVKTLAQLQAALLPPLKKVFKTFC